MNFVQEIIGKLKGFILLENIEDEEFPPNLFVSYDDLWNFLTKLEKEIKINEPDEKIIKDIIEKNFLAISNYNIKKRENQVRCQHSIYFMNFLEGQASMAISQLENLERKSELWKQYIQNKKQNTR